MSSKLIEVLVMEGIAIVMFIFAYQIGIKGKMELIAGYNKRTAAKVKDKDGLRRLMARTCLLAGIGSALMPVVTYIATDSPHGMAHAIGGYGGFIVGIIGIVMLQARDYAE